MWRFLFAAFSHGGLLEGALLELLQPVAASRINLGTHKATCPIHGQGMDRTNNMRKMAVKSQYDPVVSIRIPVDK